ncbi:polyribonucleotide nucleotidyltransferase [Brevibacillus sp. SIMBA_040]|uniref:polyribonucleotide nucleotidyltransferase n=1 Tax=unclassified Brevibacillus TaxID=2684853 RepID=UPI00397B6601
MNTSSMMSGQLSQLQHTVSLSLLNMSKNAQATSATLMLSDFSKTQASIHQASHPTLGKQLDLRI